MKFRNACLLPLIALLGACVSIKPQADSPVPLVSNVDLPRFMGDWYVIAHIPTFLDTRAHNAVENYRLNDDGSIATTYVNRRGGFDGKLKKMTPTGFVVPGTGNALWGMQFIWPFEGEYRIAHLEADYSVMIVGRSKLDYVWLMSRKPEMDEATLNGYRQQMAGWGYDLRKLERVPQQWPEQSPR